MSKKLDIQIILYNSVDYLPLLLKSLSLAKNSDWEVNLHFVNHDKNDLKVYDKTISENITSDSIKYTLDKNENVGFGKGHNFLFEEYNEEYGEFFMVLNPDMIFFYDFFEKLDESLKKIRNFGIITFDQFPVSQPEVYNKRTWEINWAAATATLIDTKTFRKVDGFDKNIFMYYEDVDLSWRVRLAGKRIYYSSICKIGHFGAASSKLDGETAGQSELTSINMLSGEAYLSKKYGLRNDSEIDSLFEAYPQYKEKALERYSEMIKEVDFPRKKRFMSLKELNNKRW